MKKYPKRQSSNIGGRKPLPSVNVDFARSGDEIDVAKMRSLMCNPIYAGIGPFPKLIDDELWVRAASQMIKKEGVEQFLVNMLYVLRESWKTIEPDEGDDDEGQDADQ